MPESTPIDIHVYRELEAAAGPEFAAELVDTFVEEAPLMLAELRSACVAAAADNFRRAAHSLKSNSLTFGATALAALARECELGGMSAEPGRDALAIDALQAEFDRAAAALKALRHG